MATTRRLAAILAADVVGYSRLMGGDEEGTLGHDLLEQAEAARRILMQPVFSAAMKLKIPVVTQQPEFVQDGALLSLDPDRREVYRRVAYYVDAILKGARPSDLPIEEPSKSWLMLNLRTANLLGIDIPGPILMRADQLIE